MLRLERGAFSMWRWEVYIFCELCSHVFSARCVIVIHIITTSWRHQLKESHKEAISDTGPTQIMVGIGSPLRGRLPWIHKENSSFYIVLGQRTLSPWPPLATMDRGKKLGCRHMDWMNRPCRTDWRPTAPLLWSIVINGSTVEHDPRMWTFWNSLCKMSTIGKARDVPVLEDLALHLHREFWWLWFPWLLDCWARFGSIKIVSIWECGIASYNNM